MPSPCSPTGLRLLSPQTCAGQPCSYWLYHAGSLAFCLPVDFDPRCRWEAGGQEGKEVGDLFRGAVAEVGSSLA